MSNMYMSHYQPGKLPGELLPKEIIMQPGVLSAAMTTDWLYRHLENIHMKKRKN